MVGGPEIPAPPPGMGMPDKEQMKRLTIRQVGLDIFKYSAVTVMQTDTGGDINWEKLDGKFRLLAKQSLAAAKAFTDIIDEDIAKAQEEAAQTASENDGPTIIPPG